MLVVLLCLICLAANADIMVPTSLGTIYLGQSTQQHQISIVGASFTNGEQVSVTFGASQSGVSFSPTFVNFGWADSAPKSFQAQSTGTVAQTVSISNVTWSCRGSSLMSASLLSVGDRGEPRWTYQTRPDPLDDYRQR